MTPNIENLLAIFHTGMTIWILCLGALLCMTVDAILPKKSGALVYTLSFATLFATLWAGWSQWQNPELIKPQNFLVIDTLTLFFLFITVLAGLITLCNSFSYIRMNASLTAEYCSLILFSIMGMVLFFATDHLIVSFIGLETFSLAIYVLVGSHKKNLKSGEAAMKYFVTSSVASAILLYGIAIFYGAFGTLRLSELTHLLAAPELSYLPKIALSLLLTGIFFKMAIVPFHFWAPDVYEGAPAPITGFMATAVKAAAFGFALRMFVNLNVLDLVQVPQLMTVLVLLTFIVGNFLAIVQKNIKRMLAYSSISHAGFLLFGILAGFKDGKYVAENADVILFYLVAYLLMTLGAFAILSLLTKQKTEATDFDDLRGLGQSHPILAGIFTLFMLSLVGMPGTIGFIAKFNVLSLAIKNSHTPLALAAVVVSVLSVYYYLKPSVIMFFNDETTPLVREIPWVLTVSVTFCAFLVVYLGIHPDAFIKLSQIAAAKF